MPGRSLTPLRATRPLAPRQLLMISLTHCLSWLQRIVAIEWGRKFLKSFV